MDARKLNTPSRPGELKATSPACSALLLIGAAAFLRICYLLFWCPLDLSADEAHYWDWSRQLDWCYYSKGPLVAYLIRASVWLFGDLAQALTGSQMPAVRLPAVVCGSLLLWALFTLTLQVFGRPRLALAVVAVAITMPLISAGSLLITIDSPYTCAWGWALVYCHRALFPPELASRVWLYWLLGGLCVAAGVLAKHTMVLFVPMLGLFLLMTPAVRRHLVSPGFWLFALTGALGGLPILLWNIHHDWVTVQHTRGHAGLQQGPSIHWLGPLNYLALQAALLLGYWFVVWACALWAYRPGRTTARVGFLWWMSLPMFAFFALFSLKNGGGEPNWPITCYLSGMVLAAGWLATFLTQASPGALAPRVLWRRATFACFTALGLGLSILIHDMRLAHPLLTRLAGAPTPEQPLPLRRVDPTCRLKGWQTLARAVDKARAELHEQGIDALVAGGNWSLPGEIAFYLDDQPVVYCLGSGLGDRHSQYDLWRPNPLADGERFLGRTFILVGIAPSKVAGAFARIEPEQLVWHFEDGRPVALWSYCIAHGYRGLDSSQPSTRY